MAETKLQDPFTELETGVYPAWALTLYLPAPPEHAYDSRFHEHVFEQLARERLLTSADDLTVGVLDRERTGVLSHLRRRGTPAGLALALVAYAPWELLRSWSLPEDEPPALELGTRLRLEPVRRQLAQHPPALVVVADKEAARVFRVLLAEVEELASLRGEAVSRHHQGGWSAPAFQRQEDQRASHNLRAVADWLGAADLSFYSSVHLGGPAEALAELRRQLPSAVQRRLSDDLDLPMYLSHGQMANRVRDALLRPAGAR